MFALQVEMGEGEEPVTHKFAVIRNEDYFPWLEKVGKVLDDISHPKPKATLVWHTPTKKNLKATVEPKSQVQARTPIQLKSPVQLSKNTRSGSLPMVKDKQDA
jgi:hypothetical protein